jgi:hypothetical protein
MRQGMRRDWSVLAVAGLALFVALGGSVYAAGKAKIDGRVVKAKSLPGNRLKLRSVPGNRLKPHSIPASGLAPGVLDGVFLSNPLTGAEINELTLGQVPRATHAETADFAQSAADAQTALNAVNAIDAQKVNGHSAGCLPGTQLFAGACWQTSPSFPAVTAPQAAIECAKQGGTLPEALQLAAFAVQPGINLDPGDEWSSDVVSFTGENAYSVATVSSAGAVKSAIFNAGGSSANRHYRCIIPLLV